MRLPANGREYVHITFSNLSTGVAVEASIDGQVWLPVTVAAGVGTVLVQGPGYPQDAVPALRLPQAGATLLIRATGAPETVIRDAGYVYVS